jgi:hypothetical protein
VLQRLLGALIQGRGVGIEVVGVVRRRWAGGTRRKWSGRYFGGVLAILDSVVDLDSSGALGFVNSGGPIPIPAPVPLALVNISQTNSG